MDLHRFAPRLALALSLALGGPVAAQQDADSLPPRAEVAPPAALDTLVTAPAATPEAAPPEVVGPEVEVAIEPEVEEEARPALLQPTAPPPASPAPQAAEPLQTPEPPDSLLAELVLLRAAVAGLATQNDSLARSLAARPARVDTVVVRDTTARTTAQRTVERVGEEATRAIQNFTPKLVLSVLLVILALYLVRGVVWLLEALAARGAERRLFYKKLIPIARLLVWMLAIYLIITAIFQIDSTSLLAAAAAIGVAVGFAAQEVLKNIFGGIVIILDQPFQVGDKIAVGGSYGEVVSIGLRSTRLVTPDDNLVSVPNSQVVADQVANANAGELNLQVVTDLYLPGWVDAALAKRIAYEAAANSKYVYLDKPIVVIVLDEFKEIFLLHLKVKAYVLDTRYESLLMSDVTEAAKAEFLRHGLLSPMWPGRAFEDLSRSGDEPPAEGRTDTHAGDADRLIVTAPGPRSAPDPAPPPDDA